VAASGPLAATSANRSGEPTPAEVAAIREIFGDGVDLYLDGGPVTASSSTVVDLTRPRAVVLREGPISAEEIAQVTRGPIGAGC
jgi:tRNA A37 threonylcarbamoyladenosine synthetase subunit TsaC/SUA5/YrdC